MLKRRFFIVALFILLALLSCSSNKVLHYKPHTVCISKETPSPYFSINLTADRNVSVVYAEYNTSSLYEITLTNELSIKKRTFIDTIDRVPPVNPLFGLNTSLITPKIQFILYLDQQTEENRILKFLYKREKTPKWYTDVLNPTGVPIAILHTEGTIIPVWEQGTNLYYVVNKKEKIPTLLFAKPAKVNRNFNLINIIYDSQPKGGMGFFAFDRLTKAIYRFDWSKARLIWEKLQNTDYPIYYAKKASGGKYSVLFYNKRTNEIDYIPAGYPEGKTLQRVTLSRETTTLFFINYNGRNFFFFNELDANENEKPFFAVSVIYPKNSDMDTDIQAKGISYQKCILVASSEPIRPIRWVFDGKKIYIVYLRSDGLYISYIDLAELIKSRNN